MTRWRRRADPATERAARDVAARDHVAVSLFAGPSVAGDRRDLDLPTGLGEAAADPQGPRVGRRGVGNQEDVSHQRRPVRRVYATGAGCPGPEVGSGRVVNPPGITFEAQDTVVTNRGRRSSAGLGVTESTPAVVAWPDRDKRQVSGAEDYPGPRRRGPFRTGTGRFPRAHRRRIERPADQQPSGAAPRSCGPRPRRIGRGERARPSLTQQSLRFVMINRTHRDLLPATARSA